MPTNEIVVTSISDLEAVVPTTCACVHATGYYQSGDGGGGFYLPASAGSYPTPNGGTIVQSDTPGYVWLLQQTAPVSAKQFGCYGDGVHDDSVCAQAGLNEAYTSAFDIYFPAGVYLVSSLETPSPENRNGFNILTDGPNTVFRKSQNGYILDLGPCCSILGGPVFDGNAAAGITGSSLQISRGSASAPDFETTGFQVVDAATFKNSEGYHVNYTVEYMGALSKILYCNFLDPPTNPACPAAVCWPMEGTGGIGNRTIHGCHSNGAICNLGYCQNGYITDCTCLVSPLQPSAGLYFPVPTEMDSIISSTRKVVVANLRIIAPPPVMTVYGTNIVFSNNITDASVVIGTGVNFAQDISFDASNVFGPNAGLTDNSLNAAMSDAVAINSLQYSGPFVPTIASGLTLGNGSLTGDFERTAEGYVTLTIRLLIGSTTEVTGAITFNLPIVPPNMTGEYLGAAFAQSTSGAVYPGICLLSTVSASMQVYSTNATPATAWNATTPLDWATGDTLILTCAYGLVY